MQNPPRLPGQITVPGAAKTITYDPLLRPLGIEVKNQAAQILAKRAYQYDPAGNITEIESDLGKTTYGYDALDRLTQASPDTALQSLGLPQEQYSYDVRPEQLVSCWFCQYLFFCKLLAGVRWVRSLHSRSPVSCFAHTLAETLEQVGILAGTDKPPTTAIVDKGYRGAQIEGVHILMSGQKRGITRTLKAMIKTRSAIELVIGHMKMDGRLARNPLKGALGDALHAVMCGAGHNLRLILATLRLLCDRFGRSIQAVIAALLAVPGNC